MQTNERQICGKLSGSITAFGLHPHRLISTTHFRSYVRRCIAQHVFHFECKQNSNTFNILLENCFPFGIQQKQEKQQKAAKE